jgi:Helix-turn-helix domain
MCTVNLDQIIAIPNPVHHKLMLALAWKYANHLGHAWPKLETLAKVTNLGRSTVQRAMTEMEALGYVTRRRRRGSTFYTIANRYLRKPPSGPSGPSEDPNAVPSQSPAAGPEPYQRNQEISQRGDISLAEPSSESTAPPVSDTRERGATPHRTSQPSRAPAAGATPPAGRDPRRRRRRRTSSQPRSPIPANWEPTPAGIAFAQERGHDDGSIRHIVQRFFYWHRKHRICLADWQAAWCDWILGREALDARARAEHRPGRGEPTSIIAALGSFRLPGEDWRQYG